MANFQYFCIKWQNGIINCTESDRVFIFYNLSKKKNKFLGKTKIKMQKMGDCALTVPMHAH